MLSTKFVNIVESLYIIIAIQSLVMFTSSCEINTALEKKYSTLEASESGILRTDLIKLRPSSWKSQGLSNLHISF